ncbi:NDP-hexose-3-ketoreductase [Nocardiopsis terrae]|uniref:NDP-hexose-3-ketoreductase n=1 Tax=Nocardiopsis terrae TaxID=372655 RepID=A0ABR9HAE0_9ACTN|nr:Gfo/Idh/MocA family oxidoreductase [Nocardiopsis terrae]MBE1455973.1 NDP-hexose-3-ketoreductase [Nocardiopsis terrae]
MTTPVALGAIGCSDIARRRTLPAVTASDATRLVCVAARDVRRARKYADEFGCAAARSYTHLLQRPDVTAVYISLPAALHADWAERALRAGKHVLVEKPLATDGAQAERLARVATDLGLVLMENFAFVHHRQHAEVDLRVRRGDIGAPRSFAASFTIPPRPADDIRYRADLGGGSLLDNGVYPLRAALRFLGPGLDIAGAVLREDRDRGVVVSGSALLVSRQGVSAHLSFGMENAYSAYYRIEGSTGSLGLDRAFTPPPDHRCVLTVHGPGGEERIAMPADDQFAAMVRDFAGAVARPGATAPALSDSLRLSALVDRIRAEAVYVTVR